MLAAVLGGSQIIGRVGLCRGVYVLLHSLEQNAVVQPSTQTAHRAPHQPVEEVADLATESVLDDWKVLTHLFPVTFLLFLRQ